MNIEMKLTATDDADLASGIAKLNARFNGTTAGGGQQGGGTQPGNTDPPPVPTAWAGDPSLPDTMPTNYAAGATIILGTQGSGQKRLELFINGTAANTGPDNCNQVMITVSDGKKTQACMDVPLKILSTSGETKNGAMHLIVYANLPDYSVIQVGIKGAGGRGMDDLCFQGGTLDYQDLVGNGNWTNHPDQAQVNGKTFDVFNGQDILLTAPIVPANGGGTGTGGGTTGGYQIPPKTAQASVVAGAKINGTPAADNILSLLAAAIPDNGTLELPAISAIGALHFTANNASIIGVGGASAKRMGSPQTILDCTGFRPFQDKALVVIDGEAAILKGLALTGAAVGDAFGANGAAIRNGDVGIKSFTVEDCEVYGCEDGILTQPVNVTILDSWFHDNGVPATSNRFGFDHDVYLGGPFPTGVITSKRNVYEKAICAHGLKCRVGTLNSEDDAFTAGGNGAGLDMPDGGTANIVRGTFTMPPAAGPTNNLITFALESAGNSVAGMVLNLTDCVWHDVTGQAILAGGNGAKLNIVNCTYDSAPPIIKGWDAGNVTGAFTKTP